jgi:two-component system sensor histidine kinase/response regulator
MQARAEPPSPARYRWFEPQRNLGHRFGAYLMVLSILPLLVLGIASFEISRSALQTEMQRHLAQLLNERKRYVDLQTEQTEDLIANISGVEAITNGLAARHDPTDNYDRLSMQARIGYILNGYVNIKGLVSIDIFSVNGTQYHVGDTLDVTQPRRHVLDDLRLQAAASTRPVHWAGLVDNVNGNSRHAKVITAAKLLYGYRPQTSERTPLGLLLVNYSTDHLREQFSEQDVAGGGAQMALVDAAGRLIVHPDVQRMGTLIEPALRERLRGESGSFLREADGASTLVHYRRSEPTGWLLVGLVPLAATNAHAAAIGQATGLVVLLCLGVAGVAAVLYSRRVVAPLHQITERFKRLRKDPTLPQQPLPVRGEDDIADLTRCFNAFLEGLQERERAEQALHEAQTERQARLAAEAANEAKSNFLARMSHDLRTPLNAVLGYAQILQRDKSLNERQHAALGTIHSSGQHLLTLINDILDLSKIEAGKLELNPRDVELPAYLKDIAATIRVKAEDKGIGFQCMLSPELPSVVRCDTTRVRQVLLNLLDNAVKFTDTGRVALRVRSMPCEGATAQSDVARLRFEVEDSGVGIAPDQIEASFQPFEQVGDVRRRTGGTGLGLAIGRNLVRVMGGDIQVRSTLGQGTCFWFDLQLPCAETGTAAAPRVRSVIGYRGRPRCVLVVDDVAENRTLVNSLLAPLGFAVLEAENGKEGVQKAQAQRPDLILMDMVMPVMDGLEATRQLRREESMASVPIISVSAIASSADRSRSLSAGANAFLPKPIDYDALITEVGALLQLDWVREGQADADEPPATQGPQRGEQPAAISRTILVADDEPAIVVSLEYLLQQAGYRVLAARDGQEVLETLQRETPDLILLDVMMPRLSGYDVCRKIRENPAWRHIRIVMVTAKGLDTQVHEGLALGADAYVTKPFSNETLLRQVRVQLEGNPV